MLSFWLKTTYRMLKARTEKETKTEKSQIFLAKTDPQNGQIRNTNASLNRHILVVFPKSHFSHFWSLMCAQSCPTFRKKRLAMEVSVYLILQIVLSTSSSIVLCKWIYYKYNLIFVFCLNECLTR